MDRMEGRNPVWEALQAGLPINKLIVQKSSQGGPLGRIVAAAREKGINVQFVDRQVLDKLSETGRHQGVLAEVAAKDYAELDDMIAGAKQKGQDLLLVLLDGVEDPHNLGSIIRTAEAAGAHGVVIPRHRAAGLTAAVARASAGAVAHLPVARATNLVQTCKQLKEAGVWVAGADAEAEQTAYTANLKGPLALVLGGEGKGISRLLKEHCDYLVKFPMYGKVNSLNVSVSAALLLYEVVRQRDQ